MKRTSKVPTVFYVQQILSEVNFVQVGAIRDQIFVVYIFDQEKDVINRLDIDQCVRYVAYNDDPKEATKFCQAQAWN